MAKTKVLGLRIEVEEYEKLEGIAARANMAISDLAKLYINEGMAQLHDKKLEDPRISMDKIEKALDERVEKVLTSVLRRIDAIQVQTPMETETSPNLGFWGHIRAAFLFHRRG